MKKTISIMSEEFENEKTGEAVEGITIMIDGVFKDFLDIIKHRTQRYENNSQLIYDALIQGLEVIKNSIKTN